MTLGRLAAEVREELLGRLEFLGFSPERILDLNPAAGATLALKRRFPRATVYALAETARELELARGRWLRSILHLRARDERLPIGDAKVDLVLACLPAGDARRCEAVLAEARRILRPRGYLSLAVYGADTMAELRAARAALDPQPLPLALLDGPTLVGALQAADFVDVVLDVDRHRLNYASLRALARDTRPLRVFCHLGRVRVPARALRTALSAGLAGDPTGEWSVTVEILYAQGFCPTGAPPQRWKRGEVVVPLSGLVRSR